MSQSMTPWEAADHIEASALEAPFAIRNALRVLIDHARATPPGATDSDECPTCGAETVRPVIGGVS